MGIEAALLASSNIIGGIMGADAAESAAGAQVQSAQDAAALQREMFNRQVQLTEPWRQAGTNALAQITQGIGAGGQFSRPFSMADYEADPGYAFRLSEGMKALDRTAAARGGLLSGATLKGAQRYGQDMASQEYQNAFNRYQVNRSNALNPLISMAGLGQTATNVLGSAGQNYANQAGEAYMGAGNARASGYIGGANAMAAGLGGAANAYQQNQIINMLLRQRQVPSGSYSWQSGNDWYGG